MVLPTRKHTAYGHPRSMHVLVFMREDVVNGVPDLLDPCIRTILSGVALCTEDLMEKPQ
jgi:hypothetical protein